MKNVMIFITLCMFCILLNASSFSANSAFIEVSVGHLGAKKDFCCVSDNTGTCVNTEKNFEAKYDKKKNIFCKHQRCSCNQTESWCEQNCLNDKTCQGYIMKKKHNQTENCEFDNQLCQCEFTTLKNF